MSLNSMRNHLSHGTVGEEGYLSLMENILANGYNSSRERTGTGTIVNPTPAQLHFNNVKHYFPLFTTKEVSFNMPACEMLWFISGGTNTKGLREKGSVNMERMWNKWADENGDLGPVYGKQWRAYKAWYHIENEYFQSTDENYYRADYVEIDQLQNVIDSIRENPESRRHIVTAWNPSDISDMALPPCHLMFQFTCEPLSKKERQQWMHSNKHDLLHGEEPPLNEETLDAHNVPKYRLHLHLTQRSADMFLGVPFNIAQYALLLMMVAEVTNTVSGNFTWTGVNCHIYQDHIDAVKTQLSRSPKNSPQVMFEKDNYNSIDEFTRDDFSLHAYHPYNKIKAPVSV